MGTNPLAYRVHTDYSYTNPNYFSTDYTTHLHTKRNLQWPIHLTTCMSLRFWRKLDPQRTPTHSQPTPEVRIECRLVQLYLLHHYAAQKLKYPMYNENKLELFLVIFCKKHPNVRMRPKSKKAPEGYTAG